MSIPSNLYAEKIFAEHPTALWALDEKCDFVSYLSDDVYPWTYSGNFASKAYDTAIYPVIEESPVVKIVGNPGTSPTPGDTKTITLTSNKDFSSSTESFTVSFYIYADNSHLDTVSLTYAGITDVVIPVSAYQDWYFVSHTFFTTTTPTKLTIKLNYLVASALDLTPNYDFYVHGFSVGYRSEEFNAESVGTSLFPIDSNININKDVYAWTGTANLSTSTFTAIDGTVRTNYAKNPNFETNTSGWTYRNGTGYPTSSTDTYFTGTRSALHTVGNTAQTSGIGVSPSTTYYVPVTPGQTYTYSIYVKDVNTSKSYISYIQWYQSNGTTIVSTSTGSTTSVSTSKWTRVSVTATAPAGAAYGRYYTYSSTTFSAGDSGKQIYFDGALFEKASSALDYFDGSFTDSQYALPAYAYGSDENYGYYLANNSTKTLYAKNNSIPMVFGASSVTVLYPNPSGPSLIVPGFGFLNDSGKYQNLVFETWLRINGSPTSLTRILGPIQSTDGLYVDGPFLIFKVGNNIISHPVGEWYRPMLVHLELNNGKMSMYVNGELIKSIKFNVSDLSLPDRYAENGKDQDYIGFYVDGTEVKTLNIDCIAIYPYTMSNVVTRKRFGYGQAVKPPENMHIAYGGLNIYPEFSQTGQSKTKKLYGKTDDSWNKVSYKENVTVKNKYLKNPEYSLPQVILNDSLLDDNDDITKWKEDLYAAQSGDPFITIRPNSNWNHVNGYIFINSISMIGKNKQAGVTAVFEKDGTADDTDIEQMLLRLEEKNTGDHVYASLLNNVVYYKYRVGNYVGTISSQTLSLGAVTFAVGFDFDKLSTVNSPLSLLMKSKNNLQMYIGGDYAEDDLEVSTTFSGKIFSASIYTKETLYSISSLFASNGVLTNATLYSSIETNDSSYKFKLLEKDFNGTKVYSLDIETKSLWLDYTPLPLLAQYVNNNSNVASSGLDFIQFNINYPESAVSDSYVKTYVMFKYNTETITTSLNGLTTVSLPSTKIVTPGSTWANKKYEVVDESLIYLPTSFASGKTFLDVDIVVFTEIKADASINYPINIRRIQLSPVSLNNTSSSGFNKTLANKIGTKNSSAIMYPYTKSGTTYDYNNLNPFAIHIDTFPYLNLTRKSGIKVINSYSATSDRGFLIPINEVGTKDFNLSSIDMSILFNESTIPSDEIALFEIISSSAEIRIFMSRIDSTVTNRGVLVAKQKNSSTGLWEEFTDIKYYLNGKLVYKPVIFAEEWNMLGLLFTNTLDMGSSTNSKINIVGSILVANLSYYQIDSAKLAQQNVEQIWNDVKIDPTDDSINLWNEYTGLTWFNVAFSQSSIVPQISPKLTYSIYTGTNKIFANLASDLEGLRTKDYQYSIYKNTTWQSFKRSAV